MSEEAVYDLLRRVPPAKIEGRLYDAINLCPDMIDTLLSTVDIPLKLVRDTETNADFVACEFNRDLDSHRSPYTSKYFPPLDDGQQIPKRLREMEKKANTAFNAYRQLYFNGGVCSVYCWEIDEGVFGFGVFIKKEISTELRSGPKFEGTIDCSDVIEVDENGPEASYSMTSSVLLKASIDVGMGENAPLTISGSTANQTTTRKKWKNDDDHIVNIGELVEGNASRFREVINHIYVSKMNEIISTMSEQNGPAVQKSMIDELSVKLAGLKK